VDGWLDHAFLHSLYFQGPLRIPEAIEFIEKRYHTWTLENMCFFLYSHLWWHYSLVLVESNDFKRALDVYNKCLFPQFPAGQDTETYRHDIQTQLNAMEFLWKVEARDESFFNMHCLGLWNALLPEVAEGFKSFPHRDFLHSILYL